MLVFPIPTDTSLVKITEQFTRQGTPDSHNMFSNFCSEGTNVVMTYQMEWDIRHPFMLTKYLNKLHIIKGKRPISRNESMIHVDLCVSTGDSRDMTEAM